MNDQNKDASASFGALTGALLLMSASILWIGLGIVTAISESGGGESDGIGGGFAITTWLNAAMFYLMGLGAIIRSAKKSKE
jgi:hypothetical protein